MSKALMGLGVLLVGAVGVFCAASREVELSGKVVSSRTLAPVSDAFVYVESGCSWEEVGMHYTTRTDDQGRFTIKAKCDVIIRVWKVGFSMTDVPMGSAWTLSRKENVVQLREIIAKNSVQESFDRSGLVEGEGFSFSLGKIVTAGADIRLTRQEGEKDLFIEALGEGGLYFQAYAKGIDFYNTPEAPITGYAKKLPLFREPMGLYYTRTQDGKHFAKVRLMKGLKPEGEGYSYWLQWAYQPDGSRNLEIAIGKEYLFPFEAFGLDRESLK